MGSCDYSILRLFCFVAFAGRAFSSNVETRIHNQLYPTKPNPPDKFAFGASTATYATGSGEGSAIYVGAPHYGGKSSDRVPLGAFYRCQLTAGADTRCDAPISTDKGGAIGMSMDEMSATQEIAICGSNYVQSCPTAQVQQRMIGVCYKYSLALQELPTPCTWACPGWQIVDLMFVVDDSGSVRGTNFGTGLEWLLSIVKNFKSRIENGEFRVGMVLFSARIKLAFSLSDYDKDYAGLTSDISSTPYVAGRYTKTGSGMQAATNELTNNGRWYATKLMIVITDGGSNGDETSVTDASLEAKNAKIITVGVGVGGFIQSEIDIIADHVPSRSLTVNDYGALKNILQDLVAVIQETTSSGLEGSTSNSTNAVTQCQLGFSTATSASKLYAGSIGSYDRTGTIMDYDLPVNKSSNTQLLNITGLEAVAKPENLTQLRETYLGYSLSSGNFLGGNVEFAVSGEPRYNSRGRVFLIASSQLTNPRTNYYFLRPSDAMWQLGAYFGQSVLGVDLNNDNFDDLLVSAPLYSHQGGYDQGRVFVYMNDPANPGPAKWSSSYSPLMLTGSNVIGSRFGMSISRVGDVDQNGYDDIVIGAPMESNAASSTGAIYLYYSSASGISEQYKQKILGSTVAPSLASFGYSLTKAPKNGVDVDGDNYPDILVSAPLSDKVIILRSRPVVDVTASVTISPPSVDLLTCLRLLQCSTVEVCIQSRQRSSSSNVAHKMVTTLTLDDSITTASLKRILFSDNATTATFVTNNRDVTQTAQCYSYGIRLNVASYTATGTASTLPLVIKYSFDFATSHKNTVRSAVLDPLAPNYAQATWLLDTGCTGNNRQCVHDLSLTANFSIPPSNTPHIIGSAPGLMTASVLLGNSGPDHSFFTRFEVVSGGLSINQVTSACAVKSDSLSVLGKTVIVMNNLASVLLSGETCNVTLIYSLEDLRRTATIEAFTITAKIYSSITNGSDPNSVNDIFTYSLPIKYAVNIVPGGTVFPTGTLLFNHSTVSTVAYSLTDPILGGNQTDIQHTFTIENRGYNFLSSAWFRFTWPEMTKDGFPLLYLYDFQCLPSTYCTCDVMNKVNKYNIPMYNDGTFNMTLRFPTATQAVLSSFTTCASATCGSIMCRITKQPEFNIITVSASYKLWLPTLVQPTINTGLSSEILLNTSASPIYPQNGVTAIQIQSLIAAFVAAGGPPVANTGSNIAAIIGAIIGGVALLAIIGIVLWKAGFFESKYQDKISQAKAAQDGEVDPGMDSANPDVTQSTADLVQE